MAHSSIDRDGVHAARQLLASDPARLRACADTVAAAALGCRESLGPEVPVLRSAVERFRLVHARAIVALADASQALGGDLDAAVAASDELEGSVAAELRAELAAENGAAEGSRR